MTTPSNRQMKPDMLGCALLILRDECPPEEHMQLCRLVEDDDGSSCSCCMEHYLRYVASGRRADPYRYDRLRWGGMIGA